MQQKGKPGFILVTLIIIIIIKRKGSKSKGKVKNQEKGNLNCFTQTPKKKTTKYQLLSYSK
jgi:hypothetical protein